MTNHWGDSGECFGVLGNGDLLGRFVELNEPLLNWILEESCFTEEKSDGSVARESIKLACKNALNRSMTVRQSNATGTGSGEPNASLYVYRGFTKWANVRSKDSSWCLEVTQRVLTLCTRSPIKKENKIQQISNQRRGKTDWLLRPTNVYDYAIFLSGHTHIYSVNVFSIIFPARYWIKFGASVEDNDFQRGRFRAPFSK